MTDWISVKDRLPDKDALVLIHALSADEYRPYLNTAWYDPSGFGWSLLPEPFIPAITHWQPLPKPPAEEEAKDES